MALTPGTRLGPYEITALIGVGGMGELKLVEGSTLADRMAQGAIPLGEALPIARQIAEAFDAAHEQGIVHRDLKPRPVEAVRHVHRLRARPRRRAYPFARDR